MANPQTMRPARDPLIIAAQQANDRMQAAAEHARQVALMTEHNYNLDLEAQMKAAALRMEAQRKLKDATDEVARLNKEISKKAANIREDKAPLKF